MQLFPSLPSPHLLPWTMSSNFQRVVQIEIPWKSRYAVKYTDS